MSDATTPSVETSPGSLRSPWSDRIFTSALAIYLLFLAGLWGLHLTGSKPDLKITAFDQVALPGEQIELHAKFEVNRLGPFNPDLQEIAIRIDPTPWGSIVESRSDSEGIGSAEVIAPQQLGSHSFVAEPVHARRYHRTDDIVTSKPKLWVWKTDDPIVVCDIDDTVTTGSGWKALMHGRGPDPMEGAAVALHDLSRAQRLMYLTARDDSILNRTRVWLTRYGFPLGPVICRDWTLTNLAKTGEHKTAVLLNLKKRFQRLTWGIGNSEGDCAAYRAAQMPHVTLDRSHCPSAPDQPTCHVAKDWFEVRSFLAKELAARRNDEEQD